VHFSVALAEFIKSQPLHLHPPPSEGGPSPAAPQLNPPPVPLPVVIVVVDVEGAAPNPVKLGLNPDPAILGAPKENPDEVADVDEVELDVPNKSGPEGGVGIEKTFPEPEPEEDAPGLGASQTVHSSANVGFIKSQVPHLHPSVFGVGGFNPAAPQLNPPEPEFVEDIIVEVLPEPKTRGVEGGFGMKTDEIVEDFPAPGFGASHTVHFSVADGEFIKSQVPHFHPSMVVVGGLNPAAPQLNPPEPEPVVAVAAAVSVVVEMVLNKAEGGLSTVTEGGTADLGVSHTVHFSVAEVGFIKSQVPHSHPSSCLGGGFKPAAPQLNPPFVVEVAMVVEEVGRGSNTGEEVGRVTVPMMGPGPDLLRLEGPAEFVVGAVVVVEEAVRGSNTEEAAGRITVPMMGPGPALLRFEGPAEVEERFQASSMRISSSANPLTSFSAFNSPELLPSLIVLLGTAKVSAGSSETAIERTSALAFLGEVAAVGDTEDAEEAVSSLSALILNRNFEGSLGAEDLRPKKDLPPVVGEIIGADDDEVPLRPEVCNWGGSPGSMISEGRRNGCEGGEGSSISTIIGSAGAGVFFCFFGDGNSSSSSTSSMVTALYPLRVVDDPF